MQRPKNLGKAILLGVAAAAVHWFITMNLLVAIGFSALSSEKPRIPYFIIEWAFKVCVFPVALLPVVGAEEWVVLNSAFWGFLLAVVARWFWNRRKRPLAA